MGNVNQVGPTGSLTYEQTGAFDFTDPYTGQTYELPRFTATTSLSPEQQRIFDMNTQTQGNLGGLASDQSAFLRDYMGEGREILEPDEALRSRAEETLMARLNPQIERDRAAQETRLANQGIGMGSRAYSAAQDDMARASNDARLGAILSAGDEQARDFSLRSAARSQPINEIMALLSGSQVQVPNFQMNRPSPIPTTDNAGIINTNFAQQQENYRNRMAAWNSGWGGLFGMGAAALGG
jgi:hypothetical protein